MPDRAGTDVNESSLHMQKFILLRGHEGAGKSTFARQKIAEFLRDYPHAEIVHIDNDAALTGPDGVYRFDFERFAEAHRGSPNATCW